MQVLDTDVLALFLHHRGQHPVLERRILSAPAAELWISIVTAEELLQGAFALIRRDQRARRGTGGYALLLRILRDLASWQILPFDGDAERIYRTMPASIRRVGAADCRIAASALSRGYVVITRNVRHFRQIPGLQFEDWTVAAS